MMPQSQQIPENLWSEEIDTVVAALRKGGVVLHPTDTIWGLACDAFSEKAVERIYKIKKRPRNKPMILLVDNLAMLKTYVPHLHPRVDTLLALHHQPLTIIYPNAVDLPEYLYSDQRTIAIRMVRDAFCQAMIAGFGKPVISTSANVHASPWPRGFGEISSEIIKASTYVVRYRREEKVTGEPSVIATVNKKGQLEFFRE